LEPLHVLLLAVLEGDQALGQNLQHENLHENHLFMKQIIKATSAPPPHEKIAALARQLWEQDGRQTGRDIEYWLNAEQQLLSAKPPNAVAASNDAARSSASPRRARVSARR